MSISIETLALARKAGPVIANAVDDWLEAHPEATTTVQDGAISRDKLNPTLVSQIENMIAPQYSSSTKYAVGDFVIKDGVLYQCTADITVAEEWDGSHWKSAIGGARNLQRAIVGFEAASGATGNQWLTFRSGGWSTSTTSHVGETAKFSASTTQVSAIAPCSPGDKFTVCLEGPTGVSRGYFFCDANMTVLSRSGTNVSYNGTVLTAPANAAYILLNNLLSRRQSGYYAYKGTAIKTRVDGLESDIDRIDAALGQTDGDISRIDSAIDRIDAKDAAQDARLTALERGGGGSGLPPAGNDGDVLYSADGEWEKVKLFDTDGETPKLTKGMVGYSVEEGTTTTLFDGSVPSQSGVEPGTRVGSFLGIPAFDYDEVTVTYNGTDYILQKDPVETNGCTTYGYVDGQPDFTSVPVNFSCSLEAPLEYAVYVLSQNPNGYTLSITATTSQASVETSDEFDAAVRSVVGNAAWYKEVPAPTVLFDADLTIQEDQEFGIYAAIPTNIIDSQISADTVFITVDYGETYEFDRQASSYDDSAFYGGVPGEATMINGQYQLNTYSYLLFGESYNFVFFKSNIGWKPGNVCHITIASKDTSTAHVPNDELDAAVKSARGYKLNHNATVTVFEDDVEGSEYNGVYTTSFEPEPFDSEEIFVTVDNRTYKMSRVDTIWHYGELDFDSEWPYIFTNYPVYISIHPDGYDVYFETSGTHHLTIIDPDTSFVVFDGDIYAESEGGSAAIHVSGADTSTMHFNTIRVTVDNGEAYDMNIALQEYAYGEIDSNGSYVFTKYPIYISMTPFEDYYYFAFSSSGEHHVIVKATGQTAMETSDEFAEAVNSVISNGITIGSTTITETELQALLALLSQDSL